MPGYKNREKVLMLGSCLFFVIFSTCIYLQIISCTSNEQESNCESEENISTVYRLSEW